MKVFLHTFGCKANQADTERVRQALEARGAVVVADSREADVAVVNSCTVTHVAEAKLRGFVRRLARGNARLRTVVMGCAAALDDGTIAALPSVGAKKGDASRVGAKGAVEVVQAVEADGALEAERSVEVTGLVGAGSAVEAERAVGVKGLPDAMRAGGADMADGLASATGKDGPANATGKDGADRVMDRGGWGAVVAGGDVRGVLRAVGLEDGGLDPLLRRFERGARAWLKVQDGCDEHCTFCATTLARGANRSRSPAEVVAEARALAERHEELVVTGVHIGSYGLDLGEGWCLSRLIERVLDAVPRVRFRLSSLEATEVDDRLFQLFLERGDRLAPHLHAPLQSASDRLLKRMGRHWYTAAAYAARVERLAEHLPAFGLGGDVMVGFPGETERDHRETVAFVSCLPFTYLHVFPYSPRPGVSAVRLGPVVAAAVQRERSAELRDLGATKGDAYRRCRCGQVADGVVAGRGRGVVEFVTQDYLTVRLDVEEWDGRARQPVVVG